MGEECGTHERRENRNILPFGVLVVKPEGKKPFWGTKV
jgi:hypothetical protein